MLNTRTGLLTLLLLTASIDAMENFAEERWLPQRQGIEHAAALSRFEDSPRLFAGQRSLRPAVVYVASIVYFVIFPALLVAMLVALTRNENLSRLRVFVLAIVIDYVVSLIFFLAYPVPERWYYNASGASLLSNSWSYLFIRTLRPLSGLGHCFPSFHTSVAIIMVTAAFVYRLRFRLTVLVLSALVLEATIVLGIHWFADLAAGVGVGCCAFRGSWQLERRPKRTGESISVRKSLLARNSA